MKKSTALRLPTADSQPCVSEKELQLALESIVSRRQARPNAADLTALAERVRLHDGLDQSEIDLQNQMSGGQTIPLRASTPVFAVPVHQPYSHLRLFWRVSKALIAAALLWIFAIGNPYKFVEIAKQAWNCGINSEVANVDTCDKPQLK